MFFLFVCRLSFVDMCSLTRFRTINWDTENYFALTVRMTYRYGTKEGDTYLFSVEG